MTDVALVLLVDDRPANLLARRAILAHQGYALITASSGTEALAIAAREELAAIVLDVHMPVIDGIEVARRLKQSPRTRHIPILFLTAVEIEVQRVHEAYSLGAFDYLIEPVDAHALRMKVAAFVDLFQQRNEVEQRYRKLVEGIDHVIAWSADPETLQLTFVSQRATRLLGYSLGQFLEPGFFVGLVHPDDRDRFVAWVGAAREGSDAACDHRILAEDGRVLWFHTGVSLETPHHGRPATVHGVSADITQVKRAGETQALLAKASLSFSESLECDSILEKLVDLVVPQLAIAAEATLADLPGMDPTRIRAGPELKDVDPAASMVVPLRTRGRTLGVLTCLVSSWSKRFAEDEVVRIESLASRAALALDNARLLGESRDATSTANTATRAREELLAVVSHDLKSPLATIVLGARRLEQVVGSDEQVVRAAKTIGRAALRMDRLIGDLLDAERIATRRFPLERRPFDPATLVKESRDQMEGPAAEKSIAIRSQSQGAHEVFCDHDRVLQVLVNLIGNAIKFSPAGTTITVRSEPHDGEVRFAVADQGRGIPAEHLERVFDRTWRGPEVAPSTAGLGLGLTIAKGIVEAHGGRIWAESKSGAGTTFFFTLPAVRTPAC